MNETEIKLYETICRHDGIKAREISNVTGVEKTELNRLLYHAPFIHELCYRDNDYRWHGLIRQTRPHYGLADFCGYYDTVAGFRNLPEEAWMEQLTEGCRRIGRNLNDTRGLLHSFRDSREVMLQLFDDMKMLDTASWEICFELRIRRARHIRIYADVLVITENKVFSLEFKMKDVIDPEEMQQTVKYAKYLDVIFGSDYEVIPALVLTKDSDLYSWEPLMCNTQESGGFRVTDSAMEVPVCSGDMLFNVFDEFLCFLER